jgi:hypothetical protein
VNQKFFEIKYIKNTVNKINRRLWQKGVDYMPYGSNRIIHFFGWWLEFFST